MKDQTMNKTIGIASIVILLAIAGCLGGSNNTGKTAPAFTVTDSTGNVLTLDSFAGKPVVMMFGSVNGCETCIAEAKNVIKPLQRETGSKLAFLTLSIVPSQESNQDLERFKSDTGANWSFARDTDGIAQRYGVTQLTTVVVLDSSHRIVLQKVEPGKDEIKQVLAL